MNNLKPALICVDWGSSNFRAFLLSSSGQLLDCISANQGMLKLAKDQFEAVLMQQVSPWLKLGPLPILMAGMVGSQRGWQEAAYVECPATIDDLASNLTWVKNNAKLKIAIVPGLKGNSISGQRDVMRGEEVQIFGALALLQQSDSNIDNQESQSQMLFCLPGTHSKWARLDLLQKQAKVRDFSTQMTGELYALLDKHSILSGNVKSATDNLVMDAEVFEQGIACAQRSGGLLHQLFSARTNVLANVLNSAEVNSYLSGMLVGYEVMEMLTQLPSTKKVYLIGSETLNSHYRHVLEKSAIQVQSISGEQAAYMGMLGIAKRAGLITKDECAVTRANNT